MSATQRSTAASSCVGATTSLTRPKRSASAASMRRPVSSMPIAETCGNAARQQRDAAIEREAADARLGQAEGRVVRRDHDVAAEHHLQAAAQRMAVDPRDDGHVERFAQRDAAKTAGARGGPIFEAAHARAALHVGAGAERALAGAGQHDDADVRGRSRSRSQMRINSRFGRGSIALRRRAGRA